MLGRISSIRRQGDLEDRITSSMFYGLDEKTIRRIDELDHQLKNAVGDERTTIERELQQLEAKRMEAAKSGEPLVDGKANLGQFLAIIEDVPAYQLPALFYLCDVHGYNMEEAMNKIDDVTIYTGELKDAAEELFDECYAHEIPDHLKHYIDYDAFARDCEMGGDMTEFEFAGSTYTVTNAACI